MPFMLPTFSLVHVAVLGLVGLEWHEMGLIEDKNRDKNGKTLKYLMKQPTSWQPVSRIKRRHYVIIERDIMTLYLCTKRSLVHQENNPDYWWQCLWCCRELLSNFLFEGQ